MKKIFVLLLIFLIGFTISMSSEDAMNFVASENNYLLDNESPGVLSPQVMIGYDNDDYWIVVGLNGGNVTTYFPINNSSETIADGAIEIRELIKTQIIVNRLYELKNSFSVGDWPFSRTNQNTFETIKTKFNDKSTEYVIIESGLEEVNQSLANEASELREDILDLAKKSMVINELIVEGIEFERDYFIEPDTNETNDYKKLFENYFKEINDYKKDFETIENKISAFRNNVGKFNDLTINEKDYYNNLAKLPNETALLNSIFSKTSQVQTFVEEIFNSILNIENFVLTLNTRKERNEAWLKMYGEDKEIIKLNNTLNTLADASKAILDEENVDFWVDQDSVNALIVNWSQAENKYNFGIYKSANEFAKDAKKNVLNILQKGIAKPEEVAIEGFLINIIIILIIAIIGVFLFEKFYLEKKKEGKENDEYYEEY